MKFPALNRKKAVQFPVEALYGGCNFRDGNHRTADTQLCAAENLWWYNGALRTRPAVIMSDTLDLSARDTDYSWKFCGENTVKNGKIVRRFLRVENLLEDRLYAFQAGYITSEGTLEYEGSMELETAHGTGLLVEYPYTDTEDLLVFLSDGSIFAQNEQKQWRCINDEVYVPCVLVKGKGFPQNTVRPLEIGTPYESRNLLTDAFTAKYTTSEGNAVYYLPYDNMDDNQSVEVCVVQPNGEEWYYFIPPQSEESNMIADTDIYIRLDRKRGALCFLNAADELTPPAVGTVNNMTVWTGKTRTTSEKRLIASMGLSAWLPDTRVGSSCLCVGGSDQAKSSVYWSAPGQILYFPEDNCVKAGNASQAVTAFGKQDDMLVVFKEREICGLKNTASATSLSLVQLHGNIGCCAPKTVVSCGNRLCWADGFGGVYTLIDGATGYSVRELSASISPALKTYTFAQWKTAHGALYKGYYLLQVSNTIYALQVDEKAFRQYASAYSDSKAQQRLAWYVWRLNEDCDILFMFGDGNAAAIWARHTTFTMDTISVCESIFFLSTTVTEQFILGENFLDTPENIPSYFRTKGYDFGKGICKKRVVRVYAGVETAEKAQMEFGYLHDDATYAEPKKIQGETVGDIVLTPKLSGVQRFGLECRAAGTVAVDSLTFVYR